MKPREKVVTAEDIQNSLYFIHVEQPDDARLLDPSPLQGPPYPENGPSSSHGAQLATLQRKPVSNPSVAGALPAAKRKPLPGALAPINALEDSHNRASDPRQTSPAFLGPDYVPRRSFESAQYHDENRPPLPQRPTQQSITQGTSLVLIRRDPASGAQWNVARIDDPTVLDVSSSTLNEPVVKRKVGAPAYITVSNPGYSKFLHTQQPNAPPLVTRVSNVSIATSSNPQGSTGVDREDGVFRRRLWMEGAKYPGGEFGHRRLKSYDSNMTSGSPRNSMDGTQRMSLDSRPPATPPFVTRENQSYSSLQISEKPSSFRGYVFTSPWNGRCEFITGAGGGSLKVRPPPLVYNHYADDRLVPPCGPRSTRGSSRSPTR